MATVAARWAGEVARTHSRRCGVLVVLLDLRGPGCWAGSEDDGGRWMTVCDEHGAVCQHRSRRLAEGHLGHPDGWCEECRGLVVAMAAEAAEAAGAVEAEVARAELAWDAWRNQ
jgi:hypothetical protein